jgi:hypothetical protein
MEIEWDESEPSASSTTDEALENDLILLLSRLERWVAALQEKRSQNRPVAVLESLGELANQLIEFEVSLGANRRHAMSVEQALRKASLTHPQIEQLDAVDRRLSTRRAQELYRNWADDLEDRRSMFSQICRALIRVIGWYFTAFGEGFTTPEPKKRWQETASVFVLDLLRVTERVQF